MTAMTREQWLSAGVDALRQRFQDAGYVIPDQVRVSVGFPYATRKAIGQCWHTKSAKDKVNQVFISPKLDKAVDALDVLAHELVHAALDCTGGHGKKFQKACKAVGLTSGKPKSASAGKELQAVLNGIARKLGEYPHSALSLVDNKKQSTRLIKAECPECGYTVRVTRKWLAKGKPLCSLHEEPVTFTTDEDDEGSED